MPFIQLLLLGAAASLVRGHAQHPEEKSGESYAEQHVSWAVFPSLLWLTKTPSSDAPGTPYVTHSSPVYQSADAESPIATHLTFKVSFSCMI